MNYTQRMWLQWADRIVVGVSLACLALGLAFDARAQDVTQAPRIVREAPVPVMRFTDQRGLELAAIESDGVLRFDYGGTVAWSQHFVGPWSIPGKYTEVLVLTYVNTPEGRKPLFLRGVLPASLRGE